jgi:hypothetical protein
MLVVYSFMKFGVNHSLRPDVIILLLLVASTASAADESDTRWNWRGWTPSLDVGMGVVTNDVDGFVRGEEIGVGTLRTPISDSDSAITPHVKFALTLTSPSLTWFPGRPSLFGTVESLPTFSLTRNVAAEGGSGGLAPPDTTGPFPEGAISGQGSRTRIKTKPLAYGLRAGLSFPVNIGGYHIQISPGVSWIRYAYDIKGVLDSAVKPDPADPFFRPISLEAYGKLYLDGVGPSLALEIDAGPAGPFITAGYIEGSAHRLLSDRKMNISDNQTITDQIGTSQYQARWGVEADKWTYRVGIGFRLYLKTQEDKR